jgi:competence protein ComEC
LIPYFDNSYYIYFFDVDQGDSSLIINHNKKDIVLIDTGGKEGSSYLVSDNVISYMKYLGINKIDYLVLTHGDYDHMGEVQKYMNNFKINNIVFNCGPYNDLEK